MFTNKDADYLVDETTIRSPKIRDSVSSFAATKRAKEVSSLFVYGSVGTGKTILASFIAWNHWKHSRIPFVFFGIAEMYNRLSTTRYSKEGRELIDSLKLAPLLVLDDLGSVDSSDFFRCILLEITDFRYVKGKPTITTCDNIESQDSRILRRLTVDNTCLVKASSEGFSFL